MMRLSTERQERYAEGRIGTELTESCSGFVDDRLFGTEVRRLHKSVSDDAAMGF
jgi:hypothetical protein